jgi:methionyl-tRNA formyltransferase
MKLIFMGTPNFALPALNALAQRHQIVAVYSQPPKPQNRGHAVHPQPVHERALQLGLPVYTPTSLKAPETVAQFQSHGAHVAVVVAYGLILPQDILDAPTWGCMNIHGSLLPRWRGAAPIHRALLVGDTETGITLMRMDAGLDTGPMLVHQSISISPHATTPDLHDSLSQLGGQLIVQALDSLEAGSLQETPQPSHGVTYAEKIQKEEGVLDWGQTPAYLDRQVRALSSWPGTWFMYNNAVIRVHAATPLTKNKQEKQGAFFKNSQHPWMIACQGGYLALDLVQKPGGRVMPVSEFLRGFPIPAQAFQHLGDEI